MASSLGAQDLPWQRSNGGASKPRDVTPRELLALVGIDDSHWNAFRDGRPQVAEERETLTKLLFRAPKFDTAQWQRWCRQDVDPAALVATPEEHRGQGFVVRGRAQRVETLELLPELVPLYEFRRFYRVTIVQEDSPHPLVVCTRQIPAQWKDAAQLDEPVSARALFLKSGETADGQTPLYFATARLAWFPDEVSATFGVTPDLVWLAERGMDIALWDEVRANNGAPISAAEGECFYQLLAHLKAATPEQLQQLEARPFDLEAVLTQPDPLLGRAYACVGTARRVRKVLVPEEYRQRLGLDHYYEIDLFVPLGEQSIRLAPVKGDKESPIYTDGFPTTFCVARLPEDMQEGDNVRQQVRLRGVFFKLWAYNSDYVNQFSENMRQPSPLLMGLEPEVIPAEPFSDWGAWIPGVLVGAIMLGVVVVWFSAWRAARGDKQFERQVLRKYKRRS